MDVSDTVEMIVASYGIRVTQIRSGNDDVIKGGEVIGLVYVALEEYSSGADSYEPFCEPSIHDCASGACDNRVRIHLNDDGLNGVFLYRLGAGSIQQCMPNILPADREMFMSGICPVCWNRMFAMSEEENE